MVLKVLPTQVSVASVAPAFNIQSKNPMISELMFYLFCNLKDESIIALLLLRDTAVKQIFMSELS